MKKLLGMLLLAIAVNSQAQEIKGTICAEKDKSPAQFASVGLLQLPDSTIVTGVITLTDGGFSFGSVEPGNYYVRVNYLGYKVTGKSVNLKEKETVTLDTLFLTETSTALDEVVVVGEKLKGKESVDRTTYSIPPLVAKSSTNGYELLKKIPQVNVDFQNNVTLNGSSNFIIQVDGRQRDKEFLAKLLPSDIESVEIISNPSGKYEGNIDGVISIILKKEARYGMNGNIFMTVKPVNKLTYTTNASLDYSMGKITFYVTGFVGGQDLNINTRNRYTYLKADSTSNSKGTGDISVRFPSLNTGFDYYMNDKNNLSFNIAYKPIRQDIKMTSDALLTGDNNSFLRTITNDNTNSDETTITLFHKKTFTKPIQELTSEATYYHFTSNEKNDFSNQFYLSEVSSPIKSDTINQEKVNDRDYFSAKFNYVQPIGMNTKLEAGYQIFYQEMNLNLIDSTDNENRYKYKEMRNSLYATLTFNYKKIGFQTVLRAENSHIRADSVTTPDYTCWLPSVNLQYKFSNAHNLKLTYNRRINRPGIYDLNPNISTGQNYDISQGNPNLKPEYRDRFQMTYTWNFGSNYFSPNMYYEFLSNKIGKGYQDTISPITHSLTSYSKPYNLLSGYEYGAGLNAMLWFVNINARIFKGSFEEYNEKTFTIPKREYASYSITSYAYAPLDKSKKTTAFAFFSYNGVNIDAQSKTYSLAFYGLGAQKQIKDHSIGFVWLLPLSSNVDLTRTETETSTYHIQNIIGFDVSWYVQVMYSYKFSKGKNVKKIGHKADVESDSKSKSIGM